MEGVEIVFCQHSLRWVVRRFWIEPLILKHESIFTTCHALSCPSTLWNFLPPQSFGRRYQTWKVTRSMFSSDAAWPVELLQHLSLSLVNQQLHFHVSPKLLPRCSTGEAVNDQMCFCFRWDYKPSLNQISTTSALCKVHEVSNGLNNVWFFLLPDSSFTCSCTQLCGSMINWLQIWSCTSSV